MYYRCSGSDLLDPSTTWTIWNAITAMHSEMAAYKCNVKERHLCESMSMSAY